MKQVPAVILDDIIIFFPVRAKIHPMVASQEALERFIEQTGNFSLQEQNVLSFLSLFSRNMPLSGIDGLKARTKLLESKYDAE